jgi:multidrug resistance efflux pump
VQSYSQFCRASWNTLLAAALAVAFGCSGPLPDRPATTELRVRRGQLVRRHLLTGAFEAVTATEIKVPRTREHRLQIQRMVTDGATVAEGEVVLEFDNSSFTANLDQQRTAVQRARRSLLQVGAQGEARLRDAEATAERARIALAKAELDVSVPPSIRSRFEQRSFELAHSKAAVEHAKALADLEAANAAVSADIRVAEEELHKARRELTVAEEAVSALQLRAPRAGIAVVEENRWEDRKYQVGDTVFPGWTIVAIPDLASLRVRAALSDVDDGSIAPGLPAVCTPDFEPALHLTGRIGDITAIAREQRVFSERRGFDVTVELDESPGEVLLVPGMSVRVEVETGHGEGLLAPRAALDLVADPPRARRFDGSWVEVVVGPCSVLECLVVEGLGEGDRLAPVVGGGP